VPEVREAQAELAQEYGIDAFCYFHYWFQGRRLLERPFAEVLGSGRPAMPFCLCWANENWTRRWDGRDDEILLRQDYSEEDDRRHIRWLIRAFEDPRYLRLGDRPVFLVYRGSALPDPSKTAATWRDEAQKAGLDPLLCLVEQWPGQFPHPRELGFDAAVEFHPSGRLLGPPMGRGGGGRNWLRRKLRRFEVNYDTAHVLDYQAYVERALSLPAPGYRRFRCAMPAWDNTPRRGPSAIVFRRSTPSGFREWLEKLVADAMAKAEDTLVFINAWNEWGEGNHLEPCQRWGHAYLEAVRDALQATSPTPSLRHEREAPSRA
jgi:lipopolysaccharide biosynthesis protein